jgi:hypothetical protein
MRERIAALKEKARRKIAHVKAQAELRVEEAETKKKFAALRLELQQRHIDALDALREAEQEELHAAWVRALKAAEPSTPEQKKRDYAKAWREKNPHRMREYQAKARAKQS